MWTSITFLFNLFGLVLLFQLIRFKVNDYLMETDKRSYWQFKRHKYVLSIAAMLGLTYAAIFFLLPEDSPLQTSLHAWHFQLAFGILFSFLISLNWTIYLRKLDVFEPEQWKHIALVFLMSCISVWFVFPVSALINAQGFALDGTVVNDFVYCVVTIGMLEELVKLLPLLIIMRFHSIVNEPYDYLLYAAVSALGFAFVENAIYIHNSAFFAANGRALMSSVAHMTFSSVIGYSYMVASCRRPGHGWYFILGGFFLASLMHGFYDFWLINPLVKSWNGLSLVFFILTTHFWFTLKNKAINASYFYDEKLTISNDDLRFYLVTMLVAILSFSTLLIGVFHGSVLAHRFIQGQIIAYGFLIYYLSFRFSKFTVVPKALAACQVALEMAIPHEPKPEEWEQHHKVKHW